MLNFTLFQTSIDWLCDVLALTVCNLDDYDEYVLPLGLLAEQMWGPLSLVCVISIPKPSKELSKALLHTFLTSSWSWFVCIMAFPFLSLIEEGSQFLYKYWRHDLIFIPGIYSVSGNHPVLVVIFCDYYIELRL